MHWMGLCYYMEKYRAKAMPIQKLARFIVPFLNPKNPRATVYCFITIVMGSKKTESPYYVKSDFFYQRFIILYLF